MAVRMFVNSQVGDDVEVISASGLTEGWSLCWCGCSEPGTCVSQRLAWRHVPLFSASLQGSYQSYWHLAGLCLAALAQLQPL